MRALLSFAVMLLSTTAVLSAQETTPKVEVFGGYSYANANQASFLDRRVNLNGWNTSLGVNFNRTFGIVGDFSGHYGSTGSTIAITCPVNQICGNGFNVSTKIHTFLVGPQASLRTSRATLFAHVLLGAAHTSNTLKNVSPNFTDSDTGFAAALGGGLDYNFGHKFAWRVQTDYLNTRFFSNSQHDFRLSTGPVFRFGGK
jgi:opacity protein-like surface antigen